MGSLLQKIGFISSSESEPLMELRLFRRLCLAYSMLALCVVIPVNYLLQLSPDINCSTFLFSVASFYIYRCTFRGRYHIKTMFFLSLALLNLVWFANGASQGSITFYFFTEFIYALIFFRGRLRWLLLALALGNGIGLMGLEYFFPQWVTHYDTVGERLADLATSLTLNAVSSSLMLWTVLTSYDREQQRLTGVNVELARAADEIRMLNEDLDRRVVERTARLEAAMREQETFNYSVSHDLRGPLRHINSYSAILEEDCGGGLSLQARSYLMRIRTASSRMGKLIDDLLELSRIGRYEVKQSPVNLSELASGISYRLQESGPDRLAEFVVAPNLQVSGDAVLLAQMLENLLSNAWKYTSVRASSRIELGSVQLEDRQVYFVKDNGVGFDMAYKEKLFGPFQRLHGSEFEGNGIGLATVKRIVERHRGTVWAEAAVNEGATIFFTLGG